MDERHATRTAEEIVDMEMFKELYLDSMNIEYTKQNWEEYGLEEENLSVIYENNNFVIVLNRDDRGGDFLNIVNKKDAILRTIEL